MCGMCAGVCGYARVCAGVRRCTWVCAVRAGVHKCAQVCSGVCGCAWVFGGWVRVCTGVRGVHNCARVCVDLHRSTHACVG